MSNQMPPPGWYQDPDGTEIQGRYWDGAQWTEQRDSAWTPSIAPPGAIPLPPKQGPSRLRTSLLNKWLIGTVACFASFIFGAVAGAGGANTAAAEPTTTTVTEQVTQPLASAPTVAAPRITKTATPPAVTKTKTVVRAPDGQFTMPNEVGVGLQDAQDRIQSVSGQPFFYSTSTDALGAHRFQILDADWIVCAQTPSAGSAVGRNGDVSFAVVKLDETCP